MAAFSGTVYSDAMNMDTTIGVILPQDSRKHRGREEIHQGIVPRKTPKTLILLHGLSDNWSVWMHRTSILRYAEDYDVAVIMPEVQRGFYQDMKNGPAYFTYVADELPGLAAELFNVSVKPEDLYVAGLSMGGYGALYLGLSRPERYRGIGCFSSGFDLRTFVEDDAFAARKELRGWDNDRRGIFGEQMKMPPSSDVYRLAEAAGKIPLIYMSCGTEDFLYESNVRMRDLLRSGSRDLKYEEWPGVHEWGFWDLSIQKMLEYFLITRASS